MFDVATELRDALIAYGIDAARAAEMSAVMCGFANPTNSTMENLRAATHRLVKAYQPATASPYPRSARQAAG